MALKWRANEMKTVTHVYADFVTHVLAPCREGENESLVIEQRKRVDLDVGRNDEFLASEAHPIVRDE